MQTELLLTPYVNLTVDDGDIWSQKLYMMYGSQANHHGHSAFTSLAPSVFRVAISNRRIVGLKDRTVTFTSRKLGRARPRTTTLDAMAFLRRFLQHV